MRKTFETLVQALEALSATQKRLLDMIFADLASGLYLFQLVQQTEYGRAELYYRCRDLERQELLAIETATDSYFTPPVPLKKLAQQDLERFRSALQSAQRR